VAGQTLEFRALNTSGILSWDFGDLNSSQANPARHAYNPNPPINTNYTARLINSGQQKTYPISVLANGGVTGNYSYHYVDGSPLLISAVTSNKAIRFLADDVGADIYKWDFGDGTVITQAPPVDHSFAGPGTFVVKLTVTKAGTPGSPATTAVPDAFTVQAPPEPPQWIVAGMAYTDGLIPGSLWQSDVSVYNPHATLPARYDVALLDAAHPVSDASELVWHTLDLDPKQSRSFTNVVGGVYGLPKGSYGALLIRGVNVPLPPVITGRTYNSGIAANGTFGLSIPAASSTAGISAQAPAASTVLIGLRDDDGAYTNVGLANLKGDYATALLTFYGPDGQTQLGQPVTVQLGPYGVRQISRILSAAPPAGAGYPGNVTGYTLSVRLLAGKGVYPYATVIDRKSTDPIVVGATDNPSSSYRVPGVIRTTGKNDTIWRTRFFVHNPSTSTATRHITLSYSYVACPATSSTCSGRNTASADVVINSKQTLGVDDFVKYWLETLNGIPVLDSTGFVNSYLDVAPSADDPNTDPLIVLGHIYNNQPTGDVGTQVPGFTPASDAASPTGANKRLLMSGLFSNATFRTNIALFLVSGTSGGATISVYSPSGDLLKQKFVGFSGVNSFVQVNDNDPTFFGGITGDKSNLSIVVDGITGSVAGYATLVDNVSGDSTLLRASPVP
jgi:PKD repeat protein